MLKSWQKYKANHELVEKVMDKFGNRKKNQPKWNSYNTILFWEEKCDSIQTIDKQNFFQNLNCNKNINHHRNIKLTMNYYKMETFLKTGITSYLSSLFLLVLRSIISLILGSVTFSKLAGRTPCFQHNKPIKMCTEWNMRCNCLLLSTDRILREEKKKCKSIKYSAFE